METAGKPAVFSMKESTLNKLFLLLTITMMIVIFLFSSQNGEESGKTSGMVLRFLFSLFGKDYDLLEEGERETWSFYIRKAAHFTEFMLLGFFASSYLETKEKRMKKKNIFFSSVLFGFLYAFSDESHQYFLDGRVMSMFDVAVDTSGVITGTAISLLIFLSSQ